jgi:putative chitinase
MTKLSENFYLAEFVDSNYAIRHGINNAPSPVVKQNLITLANGLELVRSLLKYPIFINSGYRCLELNRAIGGASTSDHVTGFAADFTCNKFGDAKKVTTAIKNSGIKYDQLIFEGTWVHISFSPKMRQQTLSATFKNGKTKYSEFK